MSLASLHALGSEYDCMWFPHQCWGVFGNCPDHCPEEFSECERGLVGVELEIDHDEARVVQRSQHAMGAHTCIAAGVAESVEGGRPGLEVGDRVLDVENGHDWKVRPGLTPAISQETGISACRGA